MLPRLSPGLHVLRRADDSTQVGLHPSRSVVVPPTVASYADLQRLAAGTLPTPDVPDPVRPLLATPRRAPRGRVALTTFGPDAGLRQHLTTALTPYDVTGVHGTPDVVVLAGVGEPRRELTDPLVGREIPHLLLRFVEGEALLGPFVAPGRTACLRCLDAARTDADPSWPLLVEQHSALTRSGRPDGVPEPVDPALAALVCAWGARDAISYLEGHRPSTWSATLRLDPLLHTIETEAWPRHPACGCTWTMAS